MRSVYIEYVKGVHSRFFLKFCSNTHGLFEELGAHAKGRGFQECPNSGAWKKLVEHVVFKCASHDSQT